MDNHNSSENTPGQADEQIQALIEGTLSAEQFATVQEKILTDPAFRKQYLRAVKTDFLLAEKFGESEKNPDTFSADSPNVSIGGNARLIPFSRKRVLRVASMAALLAIGLFIAMSFFKDGNLNEGENMVGPDSPLKENGESLPRVEFAASSIYESEAPLARGDDRIREGDLVAMREGFVSITLKSGVDVVIESPSNFAITGDNAMKLDRGAAWFRVPESGKGFSVQLPWMDVIDLGTEFTVLADEDVNRVQVSRGEVEVRGEAGGLGVQRLKAGTILEQNHLGEYTVSTGGLSLSPIGEPETEIVFQESLVEVPNKTFARRQPLVGRWEITKGTPRVSDGHYRSKSELGRTVVFGHFSRPVEAGENAIVILSFRSIAPKNLFHSEGFAGISLFHGGDECLFFGDKGHDSYSWSLTDFRYDEGGKRSRAHNLNIQGSAESFTVRYRQSNGELEVYRGWGLHGVPVLKTKITPNLEMDRIRVASGGGGDFSFDRVEVSVARE